MNATVSIPLSDLDALRKQLEVLRNENKDLREKALKAELVDDTGRTKLFLAALRKSMPVIQFGIANLDPSTVRGWPWKAINEFCDAWDAIPGMDFAEKEITVDLRAFAREAEHLEKLRAEGRHKELELVARG